METFHHVSVLADAKLTIVDWEGRAKQARVGDLVDNVHGGWKRFEVFDWFGSAQRITIEKMDKPERVCRLTGLVGEATILGESSTLLCRQRDGARWGRVKIADLTKPVYVQMPQRKVYPSSRLFSVTELDDTGLYLAPEKASEMLDVMQDAAWLGIATKRRKTELRVDMEVQRPVCFANKLIHGSFDQDFEATLEALVISGIITPPGFYDDLYESIVKDTGVIFEGATTYQSYPILMADRLEVEAPVYHIHVEKELHPVELNWLCA